MILVPTQLLNLFNNIKKSTYAYPSHSLSISYFKNPLNVLPSAEL